MTEGLSKIDGPIPPHSMFVSGFSYSARPSSRDNTLCEGPSKLSGPIQSDFQRTIEDDLYDQMSNMSFSDVPRVRDAGKHNFYADKKGTVGLLLQLNGRSITPRAFKMREKPRNHLNLNCTKIKQLMHKMKEREAQKQAQQPVKALWKSEKYKNVQSKVKEFSEKPSEPLTPREANKKFLRAHSGTVGRISRPQSARQAETENKLELELKSKDDIDFIKLNQKLATQLKLKRAPSVEFLKKIEEKQQNELKEYENKIKGKIPDYLKKRKEQWEQEELNRRVNRPDPDQPPGHRKLDENERITTLASLQEAQKKLLAEFNMLPIRNDTFKLKTQKQEYERRLVELEEAIKIFSKPKVFVKITE